MSNKSNQHIFEFEFNNSLGNEDFITSPSNYKLLKHIENWPNGWNDSRLSNIVFINGQRFSGKTHLTKIWQNLSNAVLLDIVKIQQEIEKNNDNGLTDIINQFNHCDAFIIEDLSMINLNEKFLFHLINLCVEEKKYLLITSNNRISQFNFQVSDLESRMKAIMNFEITNPDDELLGSILFKRFSDFNLKISCDLISYIVKRIERSYEAIEKTVNLANQFALKEKRAVTIPFIKDIMQKDPTIFKAEGTKDD